MSEFGFSAKGSLEIQDGIFIKGSEQINPRTRRAAVREDYVDKIIIEPNFLPKQSNEKTFNVDVSCTRRASIYSNGFAKDTTIIVNRNTSYRRVAGKNLLKDIKEFVCPIAGPKEASLLRKRLIGLQKIHKSISNEVFNFRINDA